MTTNFCGAWQCALMLPRVCVSVLLGMGVQSQQMPLMRLERPLLAETAVLLGFAVLIVRTRIKEG